VGIQTHRTRNPSTNAPASLNLQDAAAANRRFEIIVGTHSNADGTRLLGFNWKKSAAVAVDVEIYKVDPKTGTLFLIRRRLGDTSIDGAWNPIAEEGAGRDVAVPTDAGGATYRLQFGLAGAACTVEARGDFKAV
jgi:hypothetical protein